MLRTQKKKRRDNYEVPIINLTDIKISTIIKSYLKFSLPHSSVDKNKYTKINITTEFEYLAYRVDSSVPNDEKENFYKYLRSCTYRFSQNIYKSEDKTWSTLKSLTSNPDIAVLRGIKIHP